MRRRTAIVVGAGIAGLGAAAHLARRGYRVTVLEKNSRPGGRCDHFTRRGHRFDTGPTLLIMPLVYEAEFAALGADPFAMSWTCTASIQPITWSSTTAAAMTLTSDMQALSGRQLEAIEPGSFEGFLRYMRRGPAALRRRHGAPGQPRFPAGLRVLLARGICPCLYQVKPLVSVTMPTCGTTLTSPRLKAAFTFQDVYMGLSPFEAPATFSMMSYTELAHGAWYPRGGMYSVVKALVAHRPARRVCALCSMRRCAAIDVRKVVARGVVLADGRRLKADVVLANADLPYVYKSLLPEQDRWRQHLERKRFSCSVISFFWGVDAGSTDALAPHTLFLADDYRENFDSIIRDLGLPAESQSVHPCAAAGWIPRWRRRARIR